MTSRTYRTKTWIDPRQDFRSSAIQGIGSFARALIKQGEGEVVEIIGGVVWQLPEVQQRYYPHFSPFVNARIDRLRQEQR